MSPGRSRVGRALSWLEIDSAALLSNLHAFRRRLGPGVELAHVVKANAYGHGLELIAREDEASGIIHRLAVISVEELLQLRAAGVRLPVLILGYVPLAAWDDVVDGEGTPVVMNRESLEPISRAAARRGREVRIHLKVETGTQRYGIPPRELPEVSRHLQSLPGLRLEGITTHFANIEDTTDHSFADRQMEAFERVLADLRATGFEVPLPHTACSAAAILFPRSHHGLVRVGVGSYGIWPSRETRVSSRHAPGADLDLKPVLTWKTRIAQLKTVPSGAVVGYGGTWKAPADSRLAVLPIGYAEGYDRALGNVAHVLVGGRRAPVRGRVCMNVMMIDVSHHPDAKLEEEVVLLGRQGEEEITADVMAGWAGTIPYEIVARIAAHLPRIRV